MGRRENAWTIQLRVKGVCCVHIHLSHNTKWVSKATQLP